MGACECVEVKHSGEGPLPGPFPASRALTMSMTATLLPNGGFADRPGKQSLVLPIAKRVVPVIEETEDVPQADLEPPAKAETGSLHSRTLFSEAQDEVYVHNDWDEFRFKALQELNNRRRRRSGGI